MSQVVQTTNRPGGQGDLPRSPEQSQESHPRLSGSIGRQKDVSLMRLLEPLKEPLARRWPLLVLTILAGWGKFAVPLAIPWMAGRVFDTVLPHGDNPAPANANQVLLMYSMFAILIAVIIGIATFYRSALAQRLTAAVTHHLRKRLFFHMQRLSVSFFHKHHAGALGSRVSSDINHSAVILNKGIIQWSMDGMALIAASIIMFFMNWKLAIMVLGLLSINAVIIRIIGPKIRRQRKTIQDRQSAVTGCAAEYFAGISVVKAYAGEKASSANFKDTSRGVHDAQVVNSKYQGTFQALTSTVVLLTVLAVIFLGSYIIVHNPEELSKGALLAFMLYVGHVNGAVQRLSDSMVELQDGVAALDRLHDVHSIMPAPPEAAHPIYPRINGEIAFKDVTFSYPKQDEAVLKDFNYTFEAGKSYALVGTSGSGKSTITQLMLRFYDPQHGSIEIDGKPLRKISKHHYRSHVAVVLQDPIIFSGSVAENIGFADAEANFERIQAAAKAAQADEFICDLPHGYNSPLGERGVSLSGGQRQRIAIARALMRDPKLLILDEATSALDNVTERAIQEVTDQLHGTRTMIVIAHRLSTIRHVDRILVIDQGRLVEEGRYDELNERGGHFATFAAEQQEAE